MDVGEEVKIIEKELADIIVESLKQNKMDVDTAQKLAADFLAILPIESKKDLLAKLKELGDKYDPVEQIYIEELGKFTKDNEEQALVAMRDSIKQGNIEAALSAAKAVYS